VNLYEYVDIYICLCVYTYICWYICVSIHTYIDTCMYIYKYLYVYKYIFKCILVGPAIIWIRPSHYLNSDHFVIEIQLSFFDPLPKNTQLQGVEWRGGGRSRHKPLHMHHPKQFHVSLQFRDFFEVWSSSSQFWTMYG